MKRARLPGDGLLHPIVLGAIVVCAVNDHVLKLLHPSWLTGKLSDVAGLIFFPLLLQAVVELSLAAVRLWRRPELATLVTAVLLTGACFTAINLAPVLAQGYVAAMSEVRTGLASVWGGGPVLVRVTCDAQDLLALPALLVPLVIGCRRAGSYGALPRLARVPMR